MLYPFKTINTNKIYTILELYNNIINIFLKVNILIVKILLIILHPLKIIQ